MATLRIVFNNGFEMSATECGVVPHVVAEYNTLEDALSAVSSIQEDGALERVRVLKDDVLLMEFTDVILDGFQGVINDVVTLHLYMHEEGGRSTTEEDLEKVDAWDILFGSQDEEDE